MDVSFLLKSLQRRWWLLPVCIIGGLLVVSALQTEESVRFRSGAFLSVRAPSSGIGGGGFIDPDRYVQGQLLLLGSRGLVEDVATSVSNDSLIEIGPSEIRGQVEVSQIPNTDIVEIAAFGDTPELARAIAAAYTETYLALLREAATNAQQPDIDRLEDRLTVIVDQLKDVNLELEQLIAPYINSEGISIPDPRLLDPASSSARELLMADYNRVVTAQADLELTARQRINTDVVQQATLSSQPATTDVSIPSAVGYIGGAMVGLFLALVWAQFSPYALDEIAVGNAVAGTVTGRLGRHRELRHGPLRAFQRMSATSSRAVDSLGVRAEARQGPETVLRVLVIGTHRGAGSTTVALALAGRLGQSHRRVILIDGDLRDPRVSLMARSLPSPESESGTGARTRNLGFTEVVLEAPSVIALLHDDREADSGPGAIPDLIAAAAERASVVVIDGGPVLESALAVQLAAQVQAVVLVATGKRQRLDELDSIRVEIGTTKSPILVVSNNPRGRWATILARLGSSDPQPDESSE
jgi:Mrp family chromosome partitioning ATPase